MAIAPTNREECKKNVEVIKISANFFSLLIIILINKEICNAFAKSPQLVEINQEIEASKTKNLNQNANFLRENRSP